MSKETVTTADWSADDEKQAQEELKALRAADRAAGDEPAAEPTAGKPEDTPTQEATPQQPEGEAAPAASTPESQPQATPDDEAKKRKEQLETEIEELKRRKRALDGEFGSELDKRVRAQTAQFQQQVAQLQQELETARAAAKPPASEIKDEDLFKGLEDAQRDPNDPVVSLAAKLARNAASTAVQRLQAEFAKKSETLEATLRQQQLDRYTESVDRLEPGFSQVNGYNGSAPDTQWMEHLENATPPNMSVTWRQYVSMAKDQTKAAADAFRAFKASKGEVDKAPEKKPVADPSRQVAPNRSTQSQPVEAQGSQSPQEALMQLNADYDKGKIDEETWEKLSRPHLQKLGMMPSG